MDGGGVVWLLLTWWLMAQATPPPSVPDKCIEIDTIDPKPLEIPTEVAAKVIDV